MTGKEGLYPLQLLVNYWEMKPAALKPYLDELIHRGVTHVASFLPWQVFESDISHTLLRFLQAAAERKIQVSLIVTPEIGVHYPNSGLPKDLLSEQARHVDQDTIHIGLPPNALSLPSLHSDTFAKRYSNFLARLNAFAADLEKNHKSVLDYVGFVATGSFWKYFRSPRMSSRDPFGGRAGDFAKSATVEYRKTVEDFFAHPEFNKPGPQAAKRWKTQVFDSVNRSWFYQRSENQFRKRTTDLLSRSILGGATASVELHTPEADPSMLYSNFLQSITGSFGDFGRFSRLLDSLVKRVNVLEGERVSPFVHWTTLGGFKTLSDSEKQFLILKSLLLTGGQGGGILVDEQEWFSLSQAFRARVEALAAYLSHGKLRLSNQALYLTSHLWSSVGALWRELEKSIGLEASVIAATDLLPLRSEAKLLVVDPSVVVITDRLRTWLEWARAGRTVVIPSSPLFTSEAKTLLESYGVGAQAMDPELGVNAASAQVGSGSVILYDPPEKGEVGTIWKKFVDALVARIGISQSVQFSDSRLHQVILRREESAESALFVLNGCGRPVSADLCFSEPVQVGDLASWLSTGREPEVPGLSPSQRFSLDVPPCGVLPLLVRQESKVDSSRTDGVRDAAAGLGMSELPGYSEGASAWS